MDTFWTIIGFGMLTAWYMIPTVVAGIRHHQVGTVAVLNLFLGWTVVGWVVALAIAVGDNHRDRTPVIGA